MNIARRLAIAGLGLLLAAALALAWTAMEQLATLASDEAQARAQVLADALAQRVGRAANLGIPLASLAGVDTVFDERMAEFDDIAALSLVDAGGRTLAHRARETAAEGVQAIAPVRSNGIEVARVVLVHRPPGSVAMAAQWGPLLAMVAVLFALLAAEALRYALARGPDRRDAALAAACAALREGDFTRRLPLLARREFDLRPQWIAAQLRHVHERHLRVRRLAGSLRQTEPDAPRRAALDAALQEAVGHDRFAGATLDAWPDPDMRAPRSRAIGALLGTAAWLPAIAAVATSNHVDEWRWAYWAGAVALSWIAVVPVAAALAWRQRPLWVPFAAGCVPALLFAGPGLFMAATVIAQPHIAWPFASLGLWLCAWVIAGCAASMTLASWRWRPARVPDVPTSSAASAAELQGAA